MSYANIGMRPDYMSQIRPTTSVYSPLTSVAGLQRPETSDLQEVVGGLNMANTANTAIKGLTGFDTAKTVSDQIKELLAADPTAAQGALQSFGYSAADSLDLPTEVFSGAGDFNWMDNPVGMDNWASNIPGFEAPDYLSSLGMEGMGEGIDLSSLADTAGFDFSGIPYMSVLSGLSDGSWGWGDTGAAIGSYFGGPIGAAFGKFIGEPVGDLVEGIGGGIVDGVGDVLGGIGDVVGDIFGGGCFLTTACMYRHGGNFDDAGRELTALRDLRETYVRKLPDGAEVIKAYYDKAPTQVQQLVARPDNKEIFTKMYHEYITPAVEQVEAGDYPTAYKTYTNLINWVNKETEEV